MSYPLVDLGLVVELQAGIGFPIRLQGKKSGEFPFAKVGDISRNGRTGNPTLKTVDNFIDQSDVENLRAKTIPVGSILFAKIGEAIKQNHRVIAHQSLLVDNNAMAAIPSEKIDNLYLYYFLKQVDFYRLAPATTVPALRKSDLQKIQIPLPPLSEQRRIASILDKADELRQKRQQAIEKLDQLLQATFYDYFGDPIKNTKGFPLKDFKSIIKFTGGSQPPKSIFSDTCKEGYVRLVQIRDFRTDKYLTFIPKDSARRFFKRNDVMIGRYGPPVFQILRGLEGAYNVALMKAEPKAELDNDFLFYLLAVESIQQLVIANSQRSAGQTGVNLEFLNNLVIGVSPLEIQKVWVKIALNIEDQKQKLYKQLDMQNQLFSSLQNQAFSGTL